MFEIDEKQNNQYLRVLEKTLQLLREDGIDEIFLIGSVGVGGHLGYFYKTFGDIEAIAKIDDLNRIVSVMKGHGFEVLENREDRNAFLVDGVWIGFIDRSKDFEEFGLESAGAYGESKPSNLNGVYFNSLRKEYLLALYEMALLSAKKEKGKQYLFTKELLESV